MTLPGSYFEALYSSSGDPWGFTDRWYEQRKRALTLALLPDARYGRAFEPGCSIGVLTRELAARCADLLASDVAPVAVSAARERCADLPHVRVEQGCLPEAWPPGRFDLVVLSEVLYYFALDQAQEIARSAMSTGDTVVAVHWRHEVADYPISGDQAHAVLDTAATSQGLTRLAVHTDEDLVAGVWSRDPRSVAARTGLR